LDIDPSVGLQRIRTRGDRANLFETTDTLKKAREIFCSLKKPYLYRLDATQPPEALRDLILRHFLAIKAESIAQSDSQAQDKLNSQQSAQVPK
jgi:thymidylate kinase